MGPEVGEAVGGQELVERVQMVLVDGFPGQVWIRCYGACEDKVGCAPFLREGGPVVAGLCGLLGAHLGVEFLKLVRSHHLGVAGFAPGIDQGFCDGLAPVHACAEDIKEEGFGECGDGHLFESMARLSSQLRAVRSIFYEESDCQSSQSSCLLMIMHSYTHILTPCVS